MSKFTHLDESGRATMVDVSEKTETVRRAVARTRVLLNEETYGLLKSQALPKGDVLTTARVAGIMAAKRTHELIPLCHPLPLSYVGIEFETDDAERSVTISAESRTTARTGVEMEAIIAAQIAAATIYDMCKAVQKDIVITDTRLMYKSGGKSGVFQVQE